MRRRTFLRPSLGVAAVRAPAPGIVSIGSTKQLFVDDVLLAEASRISKFQYRPDKYAAHPNDAALVDDDRGAPDGLVLEELRLRARVHPFDGATPRPLAGELRT